MSDQSLNWLIIVDVTYVAILVVTAIRIIWDTTATHKTLAYLLLVFFVPIFGVLFYFSFGVNYRKRKVYSKKLIKDDQLRRRVIRQIITRSEANLRAYRERIGNATGLARLLLNSSISPLTIGNRVRVLVNGEEKFPEVLESLRSARHHIHLEYYIYEEGEIGNEIAEVLMAKAREGVKVRVIYDAFGSRGLRRRFIRDLRSAGVEVFPFNRIHFAPLANRLNYRNHRKIIVVDGATGFVGGLNISDRYANYTPRLGRRPEVFWRDTHVRIDGPGVMHLQYLFFCDWNFCAKQDLAPDADYFPLKRFPGGEESVQIAASGPDSPASTIMLSMAKAINLARREILISTPYFIPGETILNAIRVAALSGVSVKILAPGLSDSRLVNAAAWSYYDDLLSAGVEIYLYRKGFIHAKSMVVDDNLSVVGTANMDYRSFELNFEVNAVVYSEGVARTLREIFMEDLKDSERIDPVTWRERTIFKQIPEKMARLLSPLL